MARGIFSVSVLSRLLLYQESQNRQRLVKYVCLPNFGCIFSRMRSEGFPFIVGVWGWTCVRVAFLVSSSCRRRLVVVSSSPRRRVVVASSSPTR